MIRYQVTIPVWLDLPQTLRNKLVEIFELPKSGGVVVTSLSGTMRVETDGYTHEDLSGITVEKMQRYLNDEKDANFWSLFEKLINSLDDTVKTDVIASNIADANGGSAPFCEYCDAKGPIKHKGSCSRPEKSNDEETL